jgi:hypothetical protein
MILLLACRQGSSDKGAGVPSPRDTSSLAAHHELTEQFIDTAADDALVLAVIGDLSERLGSSSAEYATIMTWNKARRSVYVAWQLDAEVNNGGFNQFYYNPSGKFYPLVPESLKYIGASLLADLTRRANKTYEQQLDRIKKKQDGTLDGFSKSYKDNPLNEYDNAYYQLNKKESLEKIIVDFVRTHKSAFVQW